MPKYNVHLYREMRLLFENYEAETPEQAAKLVGDELTSNADDILCCEGLNLSALVDVAGDEEFSGSVTIVFDAQRSIDAKPKLLAALKNLADQADEDCPADYRSRHFIEALENARSVMEGL